MPYEQGCHSFEEAEQAAEPIGWPVVTKPLSDNDRPGGTIETGSVDDLQSR